MIAWLSANIGTILIGLVVLAVVIAIVCSIRKDKRSGKSSSLSCSNCNCSMCNSSGNTRAGSGCDTSKAYRCSFCIYTCYTFINGNRFCVIEHCIKNFIIKCYTICITHGFCFFKQL